MLFFPGATQQPGISVAECSDPDRRAWTTGLLAGFEGLWRPPSQVYGGFIGTGPIDIYIYIEM